MQRFCNSIGDFGKSTYFVLDKPCEHHAMAIEYPPITEGLITYLLIIHTIQS
jgi:hypothetical protein